MNNSPSPIEALASFAIAFLAGAISVTLISVYGNYMKNRGRKCSND